MEEKCKSHVPVPRGSGVNTMFIFLWRAYPKIEHCWPIESVEQMDKKHSSGVTLLHLATGCLWVSKIQLGADKFIISSFL
jgi:hypothetical protein